VIPPKTLISVSVCLLVLSAGLGVLNTRKTRELRGQVSQAESARTAAEQLRVTRESELKGREAAVAAANARVGETQTKVASIEADLSNARRERDDLQEKLRQNESEIAQLRQRVEQTGAAPAVIANPSTASGDDLQAQLDDAKRQLEAAEREKAVLSDKIKASQERSAQLEREKKARPPAGGNPGIHGKVLAVNRAYNFVVLNLGGRQGIEPNSEMLVLRGGSFIGKIRISSVEPATAIGDIITSSLARGVQVQPGDIVIYAGTNS
jgi:uncharacterized membrane-anchored protein YhcB (DUF1043 family)